MQLATWMATGPNAYQWSLEDINRKLTGAFLKPLDEYHPRVLDALLNHLTEALKREGDKRSQIDLTSEIGETGDPEWDEMVRAQNAGVDPTTLPSWQKPMRGDNG